MRVSALCRQQIPLASFVPADRFASTNFPHIRVARTLAHIKKTKYYKMENKFTESVKLRTDDELKEILIDFNKYQKDLIDAAKEELNLRNIELIDEEKQKIENLKVQVRQELKEEAKLYKPIGLFRSNWKKNIVDDPEAPQLYSRQVINVFSILFSVLFGGILLAINLKNTNNKKAILPVLLFSGTFTGLLMYVLSFVPGSTTPFTIACNLIGAMVLYNYFWWKYIGKDFKYRTKPFWIPLIIAIVIFGFIIWATIMGMQN
jgi:hypothetical protein